MVRPIGNGSLRAKTRARTLRATASAGALLLGTVGALWVHAAAQTQASSQTQTPAQTQTQTQTRGQTAAQTAGPTGVDIIDRTRAEVRRTPTTVETAPARMATLFSWYTLVQNRGFDTEWFDEPRTRMSLYRQNADTARAIDDGFRALERISTEGELISEVRGPARDVSGEPETDWPIFHGAPGAGGRTSDPGPQTGEIAWKAAIGHAFYAQPRLGTDGNVVTATPGMTTLAMAFDEETGAPAWSTAINGHRLYGTPRGTAASEPVDGTVWIRSVSGSWEDDPKTPPGLHKVDLASGELITEIPMGRVDYRRGYAPVLADRRHIAFPTVSIDLRGTPAVTGMFDTLTVHDAKSGDVWWTFRTGEMYADPASDADRYFVATEAGRVYALNRMGAARVAWTADLDTPLRTTPTVVDGMVYIAGEDGSLSAFDAATGERKWRRRTRAEQPRAYRLFSRPVVADGLLAVGAADGTLRIHDAATGRERHRVEMADWVRAAPVIREGRVYAATVDGQVAAVNARTGRVLWQSEPATHGILGDLTAGEHGLLFNASDLSIASIDYETGDMRWEHELLRHADTPQGSVRADRVAAGSEFQSSPTVLDGIVYAGGPDRFIHAFDTETGERVWRHELSASVSGSPTTYRGKVCAGQQGGADEFRCVDAKTGRPVWEADMGWVWVGAGADNGKLFVGTVEGDIAALDAGDGEELWRHRTNGGIYPHPVTDGTHVYTGSWDGYYYKLDQETGRAEWAFATPGQDYRRGGGPDSAGGVVRDGEFIARSYPAHQVALDVETGLPNWMWNPLRGVVPGVEPIRGAPPPPADGSFRKNYLMNATVGVGHGKIFTSGVQTLSPTVDAEMWALDDETGERVWTYPYAGGWSATVVMDDRVCLGSSSEPFMSCVSPEDGSVIWRTRVGDIFEESVPAVSGDKMYVVNGDGYLYAFK